MSTKRRRKSKAQRKKEAKKLSWAREQKISWEFHRILNDAVSVLAEHNVQSINISGMTWPEILKALNSLNQQGGEIMMHPDTFEKLKQMEQEAKSHFEIQLKKRNPKHSTLESKGAPPQPAVSHDGFEVINSLRAVVKPNTPPRLGEKALMLILSKEDREHLIGDLAEEFAEIQQKHGARFANIWYWKQVITSIGPLLRRTIRWGLFAWLVEWVRRRG